MTDAKALVTLALLPLLRDEPGTGPQDPAQILLHASQG